MSKRIEDIEGVGPAYGRRLREAGIRTPAELLQAGATHEGRRVLATRSGLNEKQILRWVNMSDLFRIRGIATQYAELLEACGVDTVKELQDRDPESLAAALRQANEERRLVRQVPSRKEVANWVEQARRMPPMVSH